MYKNYLLSIGLIFLLSHAEVKGSSGGELLMLPPLSCSGLPTDQSWRVNTAETVCIGGTVVLSVVTDSTYDNSVNFSYQWQSSLNGTLYTNFGSDSPTVTSLPITQPTFFRCIVSCPQGGGQSITVNLPSQVIPTNPPSVTGISVNDASICVGESITVTIQVSGNGPFAGQISNGGGSFSDENGPIIRTFVPTGTGNIQIQVTQLLDDNQCPATNLGSGVAVTVNPLPVVTGFTASPSSICLGQSVTFTATVTGTGPFLGSIGNGVGTISGNASPLTRTFTPSAAGNPSFNMTTLTDANGCVATNLGPSVSVQVNGLPAVSSFTVSPSPICLGSNATVSVGVSGTGPFTAQLNNGTTITGAGPTISTVITPATAGSFPLNVTSLTGIGGCAATTLGGSSTLVVHPRPGVVSYIATDNAICEGESVNLVLTFSGTAPFTGALTGGINFSTPPGNNTANLPINNLPVGSNTISITSLSDANCPALPAAISGFPNVTIVVADSPSVDPIVAGPFCHLESVAANEIELSSDLPNDNNVFFTWSVTEDIGFGNGASGQNIEIGGFTANNPGTTPNPVQLTVTATLNGCTGPPLTTTLVVNPKPSFTGTVSSSYCESTFYNQGPVFSGPVANSTYSWTCSPNIGFGTSGTGSVGSFTTIAIGSSSFLATLQVTPSANGCTGDPQSFSQVVHPSPVITNTLSNIGPLCQGQTLPAVNFVVDVTGSTVFWDFTSPVGYGDTGNGNLPASLANIFGNPFTVISECEVWVISPQGCPSADTLTFQVTVTPGPVIQTLNDLIFCEGDNIPPIPLVVNPSPDNVGWQLAPGSTNLGFGNPGSVFTGGTAQVPESAVFPVSSTIRVSAQLEECSSELEFDVWVIPQPEVSTPSTTVFCAGGPQVEILLTGNNTENVYFWETGTIEDSIGLTSLSGTSSIGIAPVNESIGPISDLIHVTPSITSPLLGQLTTCTGAQQTFGITVNPTPIMVGLPETVLFCDNHDLQPGDIVFNSTVPGSTFSWTIANNSSIGAPASGSGSMGFEVNNTTSTIQTGVVTVTPIFTNEIQCPGSTGSFELSVYPSPQISIDNNAPVICSGDETDIVVDGPTTTPPSFWSWTSQGTGLSGNTNCNNACSDVEDILVNGGGSPQVATYTFEAFLEGTNCSVPGGTTQVTVHPLPAAPAFASGNPASLCAGSQNAFYEVDAASGINYVWSTTTPGASVAGGGPQGSQAYVSAGTEGPIAVIITSSYSPATGVLCSADHSFTIEVSSNEQSLDFDVIALNPGTNGMTLVALANIEGATYQWGRTNLITWEEQILTGETGQGYLIGNNFAPQEFLYWVEITIGFCATKAFFQAPVNVEEATETEVAIYPVPFGDYCHVEYSGHNAISVTLLDLSGRVCAKASSDEHAGRLTLNTTSVPAGMYILSIQSGQTTHTRRILRM